MFQFEDVSNEPLEKLDHGYYKKVQNKRRKSPFQAGLAF